MACFVTGRTQKRFWSEGRILYLVFNLAISYTCVFSSQKNHSYLFIHILFYIHVKLNKIFKNLNANVEKVFWTFYASTTSKNHLTFPTIKILQLIFSFIETITQLHLIKIPIKKSRKSKNKLKSLLF